MKVKIYPQDVEDASLQLGEYKGRIKPSRFGIVFGKKVKGISQSI